jgi:molybdate transport system substrate-binding protein
MHRVFPLVLLVAAVVSCDPDTGAREREIVVSAAASLTAAFTDIGTAFEASNPGSRIVFTFGPSDGLATQIVEGAPVDVFASASPTWMDVVEGEGPASSGAPTSRRTRSRSSSIDNRPASRLENLARSGVRLVSRPRASPSAITPKCSGTPGCRTVSFPTSSPTRRTSPPS